MFLFHIITEIMPLYTVLWFGDGNYIWLLLTEIRGKLLKEVFINNVNLSTTAFVMQYTKPKKPRQIAIHKQYRLPFGSRKIHKKAEENCNTQAIPPPPFGSGKINEHAEMNCDTQAMPGRPSSKQTVHGRFSWRRNPLLTET